MHFTCSDYYQSKLALEWRQWLTERLTAEYFYDRTFYQVQVRLEPGVSMVTSLLIWLDLTGLHSATI